VVRAECATIAPGDPMPKRPDDREGTGTLEKTKPQGGLQTLDKDKVERPPLYEVLLHNDDYTTQEFVVYVLMRYFKHDATAARQIMLHVHTRGVGVAGVYPFDIAETKAHQVVQLAREHEMPLQTSVRKSQES
jgi:ATP-dependent Clp protease adaptor protein ClpS